MKRRTLVRIAVGIMVLGMAPWACGGKGRKGKTSEGQRAGKAAGSSQRGGATAEEVARKFVEAAAKRDLAAAQLCLMDASLCKLAPKKRRAGCPDYIERVKAALPGQLNVVPKGFEPGLVKKDPTMPADKEVAFYEVFPKGGGTSVGVVVMPLGGRFYVVIPVKMPR